MPDPYRLIGWAWEALFVLWIVAAFTSKRTIRKQSGRSFLLQLALGLLAAMLFWVRGPWSPVTAQQLLARNPLTANIGLLLTLLGLGIACWARLVLGRNWSGTVTVKENHELVRSGPYSVVRHPIYSGILLALLGTAVALGTLGSFLGLVVVTVALRLKSLTEEGFMEDCFQAQYATYKHEVRALIPFVW